MARRAIVFNNLAQIMQSCTNPAISQIVTCVMFSTHTNTLTELDEKHRNKPKSNYNLAKNLQSWSVTSDIGHRTSDGRTEIHTLFKTLLNFFKEYQEFITRLHLQGKVARRAIVFNNLAQIMQSCTNPAIPNPKSSHASCSQRTRTPV